MADRLLEQTFQQAKAAGKKVYVPKWAREQRKMAKAAGGSVAPGLRWDERQRCDTCACLT